MKFQDHHLKLQIILGVHKRNEKTLRGSVKRDAEKVDHTILTLVNLPVGEF